MTKRKTRKNDDVYGTRKNGKPFVYSGCVLMAILFTKPELRHGRHTYNDCRD